MRPHVNLVATAFAQSPIASTLDLLGATTTFISGEALLSSLRIGSSSRLSADAIVIDSTTMPLEGTVLRCAALCGAVRQLTSATMRTGVRWSAIPMIMVVENEGLASLVTSDFNALRVVPCSRSMGWSSIYDVIVDEVLDFALNLVDDMRQLGWDLVYYRGRWLRQRLRRPRRRGGYRPDFETDRYDGTADQWLTAETLRDRKPLSVAAFDRTITLQDLLHLRKLLLNPFVTEPALQKLIEDAPYLLRSARLELKSHPRFHRLSEGDYIEPDIVLHPALRNTIDIVELKLPQASLVVRRGKLIYQSAEVTAGIAQVREQEEVAVDPSHRSEMEAIFGEPVSVSSRTLIIGMAAGLDPDKLNRIRSHLGDFGLRAWDEILEEAVRRYSDP